MQFGATRDAYSAPFFDAAAEGQLLARQCGNGHWLPPYLAYGSRLGSCPVCGDSTLAWVPVAGEAKLVSWTVIANMPSVAGGAGEQTSGIVELAEGPWMYAALDVPAGQLAEGLPLTVHFVRAGGGEPVPVFRTSTTSED